MFDDLVAAYLSLQRYMQQHNEVELSALGMGIFFSLFVLLLVSFSVLPIWLYALRIVAQKQT